MNITIIALIMTIVFIVYVGAIYLRYGVIHSISQSYYKLKKTNRDIYFTIFCWAMAACSIMLFAKLEPGYPTKAPLFFGSAVGLAFVGAARAFYRNLTDIVHYTGAGLGFGLAIIAIFLIHPSDGVAYSVLMGSLLGPLIMYGFDMKNFIWWAEIYLFAWIAFGLFTL